MYQVALDVGVYEYAVKHAIREMNKRTDGVYSQQSLADLIGCHRLSVNRAISRLLEGNTIRVIAGNKKNGYRYEVLQ